MISTVVLYSRMYVAGVNFNPIALYQKFVYPVSPRTPMLSPLVRWNHTTKWNIAIPSKSSSSSTGSVVFSSLEVIDVSGESENHFLVDHVMEGRILFPICGYFVIVWKVLAKMVGKSYDEMAVGFENVQIHRATMISAGGKILSYCSC